jgi:Skp family chaperone for outer membrane proteins
LVTLIAGSAVARLPAADGTFFIATLNVVKVFRESQPQIKAMEAFKKELADFETQAHREKEELLKLAEQAKKLASDGQGDQAEAEKEAAIQKYEAFQSRLSAKKREMLDKEAQVYMQSYDLMCSEVKKICVARGIKLVLRSADGDPETGERKEILERVNRAVLFVDEIDITEDVIKALNGPDPAPDKPE